MAPSKRLIAFVGLGLVALILLFQTRATLTKHKASGVFDYTGGLTSVASSLSMSNTDAVLYVHYDGDPIGRRNLQFFIDHALHSKVDFYFIINGYNLTANIPEASNIHVIKRENTCYDLGSFGTVLQANDGEVMKKYKRFILTNSSVRGPFFPNWARLAKQACWTDKLFAPLSDTTKLVGLTANCEHIHGPRHLQSFGLATDSIGLEALLPALKCFTDRMDAIINGEMAITQRVRDAGYDAVPLYSAYADAGRSTQSNAAFWETCEHIDIFFPERYFEMDAHPFDTLFTKIHRQDEFTSTDPFSPLGMKVLHQLTDWADQSSFSSYDQC
ncbi:hypothetical protein BCR37DRAFT_376698 [Protomyces lactucae-debilis]|uniref:Uncharacterized protein n=1 Tax=Protomyces lactucae-debilis TaxID=2754530 RepID=A0A1Y2FS79_PROLT|nr:uncharacterized protein BCR37DRAFT_376698 [Protomyces lactucae-debilis]ORY86154.1 hypothetical protein BCR37DRAFT_376698 [Protomyces lactucae-debilis]